ncbi:MAG TPA: DMT family transporter [Terriglobia bacterium]|nr:DMT family transporter [Terriglobia bacterium]
MATTRLKNLARRGEPWALGIVLGYASAEMLDRLAVMHADVDPIVGPFLRGVPSLVLGVILVWKNRTLGQLRPQSSKYIGKRAVLSLIVAGVLSTLGLFAYYFAMRWGGLVVTVPVLQTYAIWGTLIAWFFLGERIHALALGGVGLLGLGLGLLAWGQFRGQPVSPQWYWAIPLALFTALTYGISGVMWRDAQLRGAHQSTAILLQFVASEFVALVIPAVMGKTGLILSTAGRNLIALLGSGVLSGIIAVYCYFMALRLMAVARVYAFASLSPLIAVLFARIFLHEHLSGLIISGVLLVSIGITLTQVFRPKDEKQA